MKFMSWCALGFFATILHAQARQLGAQDVVILYNSSSEESKELAKFYSEARKIPEEQLVGLNMPLAADISRAEYEKSILSPLRDHFDEKNWWTRRPDSNGRMLPMKNKIRVIAIMRGVPLRIQPTPLPPDPNVNANQPPAPQDPFRGRDDASVDSELLTFGIDGLPTLGGLNHDFFKSEKSITETNFPFLVLTCRIDAASLETCKRMIRDAIETEKSGLWGLSYIDVANKFPEGDQWMEANFRANQSRGIPTVIDRFNETLPNSYPMTSAATYYGWYDWSVSGPFLNPMFKFRRGAIAVHLHSFSAEQLSDSQKNWCAPLLERGAACTVGNVYEPYLHMSHHLSILHQRLLDGHTFVDAAWMSMPATSWQGIALGDPLYRPFAHLRGTGEVLDADRPYRALRAASLQWPADQSKRLKELDRAADRMKSGEIREAVGLAQAQSGHFAEATQTFLAAKVDLVSQAEKMRQDFHTIAMNRANGRNQLAIRGLHDAAMRYANMPEAAAVKAWLDILEPPPPPPAAAPENSQPTH